MNDAFAVALKFGLRIGRGLGMETAAAGRTELGIGSAEKALRIVTGICGLQGHGTDLKQKLKL